MISYYTAIIFMSLLALCVLCVLVNDNGRINKRDKWLFYSTYALIAFSALAEWLGIQMNGNTDFPGWGLVLVKTADYILTPLAGGTLVAQMRLKNKWFRALMIVLAANTVFQIISSFFGWMVSVDETNHYSHGPLYAVYIAAYVLVIILTIIVFIQYGRSFRKSNRASLYSIMMLVFAGIIIQEGIGGGCRTAYIALTLGAAMMFIHYSEFSQLAADDNLNSQTKKLSTDSLTGTLSRYAYVEALNECVREGTLPEELVVFMIDINGLKAANDKFGHEAGDEIILGAARCIEKVFGEKGKCYRTGGDEFVVLVNMSREEADKALSLLEKETGEWSGSRGGTLSMSAGYALASEHPGLSCEELVSRADMKMYEAKQEYYKRTGPNRRHSVSVE